MTKALTPALLVFALCGCSGGGGSTSGAIVSMTTPSPTPTSSSTAASPTDLTRLPIGDGKLVTTPQVGYLDSCQTTFNGGGATSTGAWYNAAAGTFNLTIKTAVQGSVSWAAHSLSITLSGSTRTIATNDLPSTLTGVYPIATTDPAYAYDHNPNSIQIQSYQYVVPANPTAASTPSCVSLGPIGVLLSGSVFYNALDALGRDALAHEILDGCYGHPDQSGTYHYHAFTPCIADNATGHSALMGYARDGFGIFGVHDVDGSVLTDAALDVCHGHTHSITWDGNTVTMYHYHMTYEYPYTLGCYHGTPQ
jgi:hypothetical protein